MGTAALHVGTGIIDNIAQIYKGLTLKETYNKHEFLRE